MNVATIISVQVCERILSQCSHVLTYIKRRKKKTCRIVFWSSYTTLHSDQRYMFYALVLCISANTWGCHVLVWLVGWLFFLWHQVSLCSLSWCKDLFVSTFQVLELKWETKYFGFRPHLREPDLSLNSSKLTGWYLPPFFRLNPQPQQIYTTSLQARPCLTTTNLVESSI